MPNYGYLLCPSLKNNTLYFQADDDIWRISLSDDSPQASRITAGRGPSTHPHISPDGKTLAYCGRESGELGVYLMPASGGSAQRISHMEGVKIVGWEDSQNLILSSSDESPFGKRMFLYRYNLKEQTTVGLPHGPGTQYDRDEHGNIVIGRNCGDPAYWKRYRGGTAGSLWVKTAKRKSFQHILKNLETNLTNPKLIGGRVYFISDHEGIGNIYSCTLTGRGLTRHTHQQNYYVRSFSYCQETDQLAYAAGGELFLLDLESEEEKNIEIILATPSTHAQPRYEYAGRYLQDFALGRGAQQVALTFRGGLHVMPPWGGAPKCLAGDPGERYKLPMFYQSEKNQHRLLAIRMDQNTDEQLVEFNTDTRRSRVLLKDNTLGKVQQIKVHPKDEFAAVANNRNELWLIGLGQKRTKVLIEQNPYVEPFQSLDWSPCGRYLAYQGAKGHDKKGIYLYDTQTKKSQELVGPILNDSDARFSHDGKYLFFLGAREFYPAMSEVHFDLSFPYASRPYVVVLKKDEPSPFDKNLNFDDDKNDGDEGQENDKKKKEIKTEIDWEGLEHRILPFPMEMGGHVDIKVAQDKVFFLKSSPQPSADFQYMSSPHLSYYDFKSQKCESYHSYVDRFSSDPTHKYLIYETDGEIRLTPADSKPGDGDDYAKKDGWVDLNRVKVKINPREEWKQMYREAWVLQKEHFWTEDMSKVEWEKIYERYLPLLDRIHTRSEFSDLMWEMQGELGTSHCYEFGGEYTRRAKTHFTGKLGARVSFQKRQKCFVIEEIFRGHSWVKGEDSPLNAPGVSLKEGDKILEIDGEVADGPLKIDQLLEAKARRKTLLKVKRQGKKNSEELTVVPLSSQKSLIYRQWVEENKKEVHKKTRDRVGYVHIPDMGNEGFGEFFKYYLSECWKEALIVDVRGNRGGYVSQLLLRLLTQRIIGFDQTRWFDSEPYPLHAVPGPIICLTDEHAGSDGDIFSHSFKLLKLGKLIGKRTWGGVVGIFPRHPLNDGTITSQPEFSFWFKDVGWKVENYGTDPDIEVEITPEDWAKGRDTQLERGIREITQDLRKNPPLKFEGKYKPNLRPPKLK